MADTPDTPPTGADTPTTPRRRGPRKTSVAKTVKTRRATKLPIEKAEAAVKTAATRAKRTATKAEGAVVDAAKSVVPRASPRSKTATAKAPRKTPVKKAAASKKKKTSAWGVAAIAGGLAAAGAAAAALLSLKSSTGKNDTAALPGGAHQPDGTDSSASFDAKIADENTVPA